MAKVKCWCCNEEVNLKECNGVFRKHHRYYCQKEECQEAFIEDAGDRPTDEEDFIYN